MKFFKTRCFGVKLLKILLSNNIFLSFKTLKPFNFSFRRNYLFNLNNQIQNPVLYFFEKYEYIK